jgi:hypothetical protein
MKPRRLLNPGRVYRLSWLFLFQGALILDYAKNFRRLEMLKRVLGAVFLVLVFCSKSLAMHPLITDDTGTQGKGKFQIEFNYEFDHEDTDGVEENLHEVAMVVSYGIIDSIDFVVGLPYQSITTKEGRLKTKEDGISDISLELKYRFFEREGLTLALKPGLSIPTGDDEKGLGAGKVGGSFFFIATQELEPFTFHFNAGYGRNETTVDDETDIWHVSFATEYEVTKWVKLVANIGAERNTDREDDTPAAFILGGLVIPVTENIDLDFGVKGGLTEPETDYAFLAGAAFRF